MLLSCWCSRSRLLCMRLQVGAAPIGTPRRLGDGLLRKEAGGSNHSQACRESVGNGTSEQGGGHSKGQQGWARRLESSLRQWASSFSCMSRNSAGSSGLRPSGEAQVTWIVARAER